MRIKVNRPDGLLLWITDGTSQSTQMEFLAIGLSNGYLDAGYNLGTGEVWLTWNNYQLDDSQWHTVSFTRSVVNNKVV